MSADCQSWFIYIIECADGTLYTGVTTDVQRRLHEHNHCNKKAAKYTRARRPVILKHSEAHPSKTAAYQREWQIKQLNKQRKQQLFAHAN